MNDAMRHNALVALTAHPELRGLVELMRRGWQIVPLLDELGQVVEIQGTKGWPGSLHVDVIRIRDRDDVQGLRSDGEQPPRLLWVRHGALDEVVDDLLALPAPGTRAAPQLAAGPVAPLWFVE